MDRPVAASASNEFVASDLSIERALDQLRLRLLDLTGRNRLLNFRHSPGRSLQFVHCDPDALFTRLLTPNGNRITIQATPEPDREQWIERTGRLTRPEARDHAVSLGIDPSYDLKDGAALPALERTGQTVNVLYYPEELGKHCRKLERETKLAIEETGANILHLVIGFLEFPESSNSDKLLLAPLISIPVRLEKVATSQYSTFRLQATGEEIAENLSLREKLKRDYQFLLPEFPEEMESLAPYLAEVRLAIGRLPRWRVRRMVSLALLSFQNMLLVRDLEPHRWVTKDGKSALLGHPIVRRVFQGSESEGSVQYGEEYSIDEHPLADLPLIYDADSSQHSALIDAMDGRTMVIEGPPGTGKSQTITNIVAACLNAGKSVLFVAEKMAALDVVKTRLALAGLDPFVLELHSSKANKKRVLDDVAKRMDLRISGPEKLPELLADFRAKRQQLREYAALLNSDAGNLLGCSVHQVLWRAERHRLKLGGAMECCRELFYEAAPNTVPGELRGLHDLTAYLTRQYREIGSFDERHPFWGFQPKQLHPGDDLHIQRRFEDVQASLRELGKILRAVESSMPGASGHLAGEKVPGIIEGLQRLVPMLAPTAAVELLPGLFPESDPRGLRSNALLDRARAALDDISVLAQKIRGRVRDGLEADADTERRIKDTQKLVSALGLTEKTAAQLAELADRLEQSAEAAAHALAELAAVAEKLAVPFDGSQTRLRAVCIVIGEIEAVPDRLLDLRHPLLADSHAREILSRAAVDLGEIRSRQGQLSERLYLDALPAADAIKTAIQTLRQGGTWYRLFQPTWKRAIRLHRDLERNKSRKKASARLLDLDAISDLQRRSEAWTADERIKRYCGHAYSALDTPVSDLQEAAEWIYRAGTRLEAALISAHLFDPLTLTASELIRLREAVRPGVSAMQAAQGIDAAVSAELPSHAPSVAAVLQCENSAQRLDGIKRVAALIRKASDYIDSHTLGGLTAREALSALETTVELRRKEASLAAITDLRQLVGERFPTLSEDMEAIKAAWTFGHLVRTSELPGPIQSLLLARTAGSNLSELLAQCQRAQVGWTQVASFQSALNQYGAFDLAAWARRPFEQGASSVEAMEWRAKESVEQLHLLGSWSAYLRLRDESATHGLLPFLELVEQGKLPAEQFSEAFSYRFYASIARSLFRLHPLLARFNGITHSKLREDFAAVDRELIALHGKQVGTSSYRAAQPPEGFSGARVDEKTEMALLRYLVPQSRPRVPVRQLLSRAGAAVQVLKPCFMMGPQAVAQFLEPMKLQFDVVIMDEASQLRPEEAIGAIARGKQLIVVGDPNQLPPTTFFSRGGLDVEDEQGPIAVIESPSILDVAISHFQPIRRLRWHYRSQHESLIAFSNHNFYRGKLVVFPSPYPKGKFLGVHYHYIRDAIYEDQLNSKEAKRVVEFVVDHIATRPDESLGVVTLNIRQRDLVAELLEERIKTVPQGEQYRERWEKEGAPLFVKNLENVQGDERDAIIISTTYGRGQGTEVVRQNFGPISRGDGWKRLNVLFTRARRSLLVVSSMKPEDIVIDSGTPEGTKQLHHYLKYATTGYLHTEEPSTDLAESDFEVAVIDVLKAGGYEVTPQLGVAGFRIDIAVRHPDHRSIYLAAVECDGATYHSGVSVRDRDRIRQEVLESLGWKGRLWRIWSTDWFRNPKGEIEKLLCFLSDLRAKPIEPQYESAFPDQDKLSASFASSDVAASPLLVEEDRGIEIGVGDVITYVDQTLDARTELTLRITQKITDFERGLVARHMPLAQVLLGASPGETVVLRGPGKVPRSLQIRSVTKGGSPQHPE